jgi:hypothetical protein
MKQSSVRSVGVEGMDALELNASNIQAASMHHGGHCDSRDGARLVHACAYNQRGMVVTFWQIM